MLSVGRRGTLYDKKASVNDKEKAKRLECKFIQPKQEHNLPGE